MQGCPLRPHRVGGILCWRITAANGMLLKLLRLIKAYYVPTKMNGRASDDASMSSEVRPSV